MGQGTNYKTKQREIILNYMISLEGAHFTVNEIAEYFEKQDIAIGITTIYRHLDRFLTEGIVQKYILDGKLGACFQYIGEGEEDHTHFHLKCEICGQLIHLQCKTLSTFGTHILEEHGFAINPLKTVFYGTCSKCS